MRRGASVPARAQPRAQGTYVTDRSHMPRPHRDYAEWGGDRFHRRAAERGEHVLAVADATLRSRQAERQSYRTCRALLALGERRVCLIASQLRF